MSTATPTADSARVATPAAPMAPHPAIEGYYSDLRDKRPFLRRIFDETAGDYDRVESVLAFGTGPWYRRRSLRRAGLKEGDRILDVAMGTGLVSREARAIVGPGGFVLGVDPSAGMVAQARRTLADVPAVLGLGEALPVADASFDFLSLGYALRHLPDLRGTFAEFARVLKPGGRVCILEITRPANRVHRAAVAAYFKGVLPVLSRVVGTSARTRELWKYYWQTIDACVPPAQVIEALGGAGLKDARVHIDGGLFASFTATKA